MASSVYSLSLGKKNPVNIDEILSRELTTELPYDDANYFYTTDFNSYSNEDTTYGESRNLPLICADGVGGSEKPKIASMIITEFLKDLTYEEATRQNVVLRLREAVVEMKRKSGNAKGSTTLLAVWVQKTSDKLFEVKVLNIGDCKCYLYARGRVFSLSSGPNSLIPRHLDEKVKFNQEKFPSLSVEEANIYTYATSNRSNCMPVPNQIESGENLDDEHIFFSYEEEYNQTKPFSIERGILNGVFWSEYKVENTNSIKLVLMSDGAYDNLSQFYIQEQVNENLTTLCNKLFVKAIKNANTAVELISSRNAARFIEKLTIEFIKKFPNSRQQFNSPIENRFVLDFLNDELRKRGLRKVNDLDEYPLCNFYDAVCSQINLAREYLSNRYHYSGFRKVASVCNYVMKFFSMRKKDDISIIGASFN